MIRRSLERKDAYGTVLLDDNFAKYTLDEAVWRRLTILKELLDHFNTLTTKVCASKSYATITMTIIVYNKIMGIIEDFRKSNEERSPDICHAANTAYKKLAKYYAATDKSPIYSVATASHPAMRFRYWSDHIWGDQYEKCAKNAVRNVWRAQYSGITIEDIIQQPQDDSNSDIELDFLGLTKTKTARRDELEEFVSSPTASETPLLYWKKNCETYPQLAKMARDFLAVPATSAPSERCFSKARSLLPYTRNRLGADKIQEQMLMDS